MKMYRNRYPPEYHLENVKVPTYVYYSRGDAISNYMDVRRLIKKLGNVKNTHFIDDDQWNHGGFLLANSVKSEINDRIIKFCGDY